MNSTVKDNEIVGRVNITFIPWINPYRIGRTG